MLRYPTYNESQVPFPFGDFPEPLIPWIMRPMWIAQWMPMSAAPNESRASSSSGVVGQMPDERR